MIRGVPGDPRIPSLPERTNLDPDGLLGVGGRLGRRRSHQPGTGSPIPDEPKEDQMGLKQISPSRCR